MYVYLTMCYSFIYYIHSHECFNYNAPGQVEALREEVKHHKEMCANYEKQLQRTQQQMTQEMAEKEEAVETMMDTLEKHKVSRSQ